MFQGRNLTNKISEIALSPTLGLVIGEMGQKKKGTEQLTSTEADCSAPLKDIGTVDLQD